MNKATTIFALTAVLAVAACGCGTNPQYSAKLNDPAEQPGDGIFDLENGGEEQLDRGFATAYYQRGVEHAKKGDHYSAIIEFEHALGVDPKYPDAWYAKALSCEAVGEKEFAMQAYRAFLGCADPKDTRIAIAKTKLAPPEKEEGE